MLHLWYPRKNPFTKFYFGEVGEDGVSGWNKAKNVSMFSGIWALLITQLVKKPSAMQETLVQLPGSERSTGEAIGYVLQYSWTSVVAQLVKNPPAMWETWLQLLGWEGPLEKERLPTPVFWPGEFHGLYSPWGLKKSDTTERLSLSLSQVYLFSVKWRGNFWDKDQNSLKFFWNKIKKWPKRRYW